MRRCLVWLIALALLPMLVPTASARALGTVSLIGPTLAVAVDEPFVLRGKVPGAKPGTVVQLQQRKNGSWVKVASKKLVSGRSYSFTREVSTVGNVRYRAFVKAQLGQPSAVSPQVLVTIRPAMEVTVTTHRAGSLYEVSGSVVTGNREDDVRLEGLIDGTWTFLNLAATDSVTGEFLVGTTYPQSGVTATRLRIPGNATYATFYGALPNVDAVHIPVTLGEPTAAHINELSGGQDLSFDFTAVAGRAYSVHVDGASSPLPAGAAWTMRQGVDIVPTTAESLWIAPDDGPMSLYYSAETSAALADTAQITIWEAVTLTAAADVTQSPTLGPGEYVRVGFEVATCPGPVYFGFNPDNLGDDGDAYVHIFGPSTDAYSYFTARDSVATFEYACFAGSWEAFIKRSDSSSGSIEFFWSMTNPS